MLRSGAESRKIACLTELNKEDKVMMPVRRNTNWLPGIFNDFFGNEWLQKSAVSTPAVNIFETERDYRIEVAAPGLTKDDFEIKIDEDNELVVSMQKKEERKEGERNGRYLRREFTQTQVQQRMMLPDDVEKEKIRAKVENGVLTIDIPKRIEVREKPSTRKIEIR